MSADAKLVDIVLTLVVEFRKQVETHYQLRMEFNDLKKKYMLLERRVSDYESRSEQAIARISP
jgi:uncharacterized protein YktA (UPF0223 family)